MGSSACSKRWRHRERRSSRRFISHLRKSSPCLTISTSWEKESFASPAKYPTLQFSSLGYPCPVNYNLADHLIHTLAIVPGEEDECRARVQVISKEFKSSSYGQQHNSLLDKMMEFEKNKKRPTDIAKLNFKDAYYTNSCNQLKWLLYRSCKRIARDPYFLVIKCVEAMGLALFLGILFFKTDFDELVVRNYMGVLFFLMTDICFDMVYNPVNVFPQDMPIMNRDRTTGLYSPTVFYFSQVVCSFILGFIVTIIRVCVAYWMVDFKTQDSPAMIFFIVLLIYESVQQVALAYGYLVCCIGGTLSLSMALANPMMLIPMMFAGFFIAKKSIPTALGWICYLSFFYYGFEAISIVLWKGVGEAPMQCHGNMTVSYTQILEQWGYAEKNLPFDISMLYILLAVYHGIALLALNVRYRRK